MLCSIQPLSDALSVLELVCPIRYQHQLPYQHMGPAFSPGLPSTQEHQPAAECMPGFTNPYCRLGARMALSGQSCRSAQHYHIVLFLVYYSTAGLMPSHPPSPFLNSGVLSPGRQGPGAEAGEAGGERMGIGGGAAAERHNPQTQLRAKQAWLVCAAAY